MKRREFAVLLVSVLTGRVALAQQSGRMFRVGWILPTATAADIPGFRWTSGSSEALIAELRNLGYVRDVNVQFDVVTAEGRPERYPDLAAAIVRRKPDVIIVSGSQVAVATRKATSTIPIVMSAAADPVKYGLVVSLARPGGNVTGLSADAGAEIEGKRLEYLKQVVPHIKRVSCLVTKWIWDGPYGRELERSGKVLGVQVQFAELTPSDLQATFQRVAAQQPDALFVVLAPEVLALRHKIMEFSNSARIPVTGPFAELTEAGALMSYGYSLPELGRAAARYVDKIFRGASPAELPVQRPSVFELVINQKTAKALGIRIPQSILVRADRVIE